LKELERRKLIEKSSKKGIARELWSRQAGCRNRSEGRNYGMEQSCEILGQKVSGNRTHLEKKKKVAIVEKETITGK